MTSIILFSVGMPALKEIKRPQWTWIGLSALFGTFFQPFVAFAQKHIDSAVASILNSFTPLATAILGYTVLDCDQTRDIGCSDWTGGFHHADFGWYEK